MSVFFMVSIPKSRLTLIHPTIAIEPATVERQVWDIGFPASTAGMGRVAAGYQNVA